ncbi:MAG: rRNA pseudouridine synthase [Myxococcales bacterium]|nr:rRNA pseudouridine synthase [Myxococcales bacterium]
MTDGIRLNKRMAQLGLCSRREADRYISAGQVRVDGEVVTELGTRVGPDALVSLGEAAAAAQALKATVLLHKPPGFVSGQPEDGYTAAVELVRPENQDNRAPWRPWGRERPPMGWRRELAPAGRLDIDSSGLLVLTADGVVARTLIGPERGVDKEYVVGIVGRVDDRVLELLRHGLELDGEALLPAQIEHIAPTKLKFVLRQGKKRQIRRMCELVGLRVHSLLRVRIGNIRLSDLPRGQFRFLRPDERF